MSSAGALTSLPLLLLVVAGIAAAEPPPGPLGPSREERLDAEVDTRLAYRAVPANLVPVVPSSALPRGLVLEPSNNNLSIALHESRLFLAFRTAPTRFASSRARLLVLSSPDLGGRWTLETSFATGRDLREPFLLEVAGRLHLYFVELGSRVYAFEPRSLWRTSRCGPGCWSAPERWGGPDEVAWDFKVRRGRAWMTSYQGKHYELRSRPIDLRFRRSDDGVAWRDVGDAPVYRGGATEASFEFDARGALWAITRNEDGDATGFGSHVATADAAEPGAWRFPVRSDPRRYDSPRLFRHGKDIYLLARRDLGPAAGTRFGSLSGDLRKLFVWVGYSLAPKRTSLYRLDPASRRFDPVFDLPSAGDTAFPSVARLSAHEFLVANYSSSFRDVDHGWLRGQVSATGIYFVRLRFEPLEAGGAPPPSLRDPTGATTTAALVPRPGPPAGFDEDWPATEGRSHGRLAPWGVLSVGAGVLVLVRRRRRRPVASS
jgi:hypothetical protein